MTHTVSPTTAQALKAAGFPRPEPEFAQRWWYKNPDLPEFRLVIVGTAEFHLLEGQMQNTTFAPTLEDITPHLPPTFALEMWGGHQSCTNRDDEKPLRTLGENFAEAAAEMWLKIQKARI